MFLLTKVCIFVVSVVYLIDLAKSQTTYELELNKYFISDFDQKNWVILKQDLEKGKDSLTFLQPANTSAGIVVWYYMQTKNGNEAGHITLCQYYKQPEKMNYKYLVRHIVTQGILGKQCPIKANETVQPKNSYKITSKAFQDIEGILQMSLYFEFPRDWEPKVRYDVVGTVKAK